MAPRFIARQLANPSGFIGRLIMAEMNRRNAKLSAYALSLLTIEPADRVLEIGFGGGLLLPQLLEGAAFVAGLDRSETAVAAARRRYARAVKSGRADFRLGDVAAQPFANGAFDKALTVNTVYFWPSLDAGFAELARVLAPGGRLAVGFLPKEHMAPMNMPADIFTGRAPEDVMASLTRVGFTNVSAKRPEPSTLWNVVVAGR
jgi:arsenite methyltransferase